MSHLIIELALALVAATLIGWLMGRYLCKSGEYDERAWRRRLESELAIRDQDLEVARQTLGMLHGQLQEKARSAGLAEEENRVLVAKYEAAQRTQTELLSEFQTLQVCKAHLDALESEYAQSQRQVVDLRVSRSHQQAEIQTLQDALTRANARLQDSEQESQRKQDEIEHASAEIDNLRTGTSKDADRIASLLQENAKLQQRVQELVDEHASCLSRLEGLAASVDRLHGHIRERQRPHPIPFFRLGKGR